MERKYKQRTAKIFLVREDNPKCKILDKGKAFLTDRELLAIVLAPNKSIEKSMILAGEILALCGNNLIELSRKNFKELMDLGITEQQAAVIMAVMELGNRKRSQDALLREKMAGSRDAYEAIYAQLSDRQYESFMIILLNRSNRIIRIVNISEGGVSGTVADPKKIFKMALENNASSIILAHNHPSGNTAPSETDIMLTRKLKDAGLLMDLPVIDHLIIGNNTYYSFADEGLL